MSWPAFGTFFRAKGGFGNVFYALLTVIGEPEQTTRTGLLEGLSQLVSD
jgi:hypothetical protein